jgi:nitroimidazol reductase NimA-like FMN-containing flavoprotein (pyridoxamine 5'-phosphate oxidase superfamily)
MATPTPRELGASAREIIDSNRYMTLGTADETGQPWVSPRVVRAGGIPELFWVSSPEARHSRNLASRPELAIVIFDSTAAIGTGGEHAVYMSAVAEQQEGDDLDRGIAIFSRRSEEQGGLAWTREDILPPAPYRLYRATVSEHSMLDPTASPDRRTPVTV